MPPRAATLPSPSVSWSPAILKTQINGKNAKLKYCGFIRKLSILGEKLDNKIILFIVYLSIFVSKVQSFSMK